MSADKHPISVGQPTEFTLCWRVHRDGYVCIREEGHPAVDADARAEHIRARIARAYAVAEDVRTGRRDPLSAS